MAGNEQNHGLGVLARTRTPEQQAAYERSFSAGKCPFCGKLHEMPPEIQQRMIAQGKYWRVWHNPFPYPGHEHHLILAPIKHLTQPHELSGGAMKEWFEINNGMIEKFGMKGGGLVMRFGGEANKGNSITHLHSHIQEPNGTNFSMAVFFANPALQEFFASQTKKPK